MSKVYGGLPTNDVRGEKDRAFWISTLYIFAFWTDKPPPGEVWQCLSLLSWLRTHTHTWPSLACLLYGGLGRNIHWPTGIEGVQASLVKGSWRPSLGTIWKASEGCGIICTQHGMMPCRCANDTIASACPICYVAGDCSLIETTSSQDVESALYQPHLQICVMQSCDPSRRWIGSIFHSVTQ